MSIQIEEMLREEIHLMVDYFLNADESFLRGMGADPAKLPSRSQWISLLEEDLQKPLAKRSFFYLVWKVEDRPVGHTNINKIHFGDHASMHLHIWYPEARRAGLGFHALQQSIPIFFNKFQLKKLICEPYAHNPAPNRTLSKLGFEFIRTYETTPGWINYHQSVSRYELRKAVAEQFFVM